jgi:hypothetical protein
MKASLVNCDSGQSVQLTVADLDTPDGEDTVEMYVWLPGRKQAVGAVYFSRAEMLKELGAAL